MIRRSSVPRNGDRTVSAARAPNESRITMYEGEDNDDYYSNIEHVSMAKMHMMLLFAFAALWLLHLHIIDFRKIEDFKRTTNDTMIPGFLVLNTVTTMSVSAEFGKPYSAAIFEFTGLITTIILVKTYQGLLDWFDKFYFIMSSGVAAAYATKSGKRAGRYF